MTRFSAQQLDLVRVCAEDCAARVPRPNEMAVYELVKSRHADMFSDELLGILRYVALETERQNEGAVPVYNFLLAWNRALVKQQEGRRLDLDLLFEIAALIEPDANRNGYRRHGVMFLIGTSDEVGFPGGSDPEDIPNHMEELALYLDAHQDGLRADDYGRPITSQIIYVRFQKIHPRSNGNGREGKVIFNWLNGTLACPTFPEEPAEFKRNRGSENDKNL